MAVRFAKVLAKPSLNSTRTACITEFYTNLRNQRQINTNIS